MIHCQYLRIRLTDRCNLKCQWCHNEGGSKLNKNNIEMSPALIFRAVQLFKELGYKKIKLVGGEPTVRSDLPEIIYTLNTLPGIEISMITNGTRLNLSLLEKLKEAGLKRINLSVNTVHLDRYRVLQGGSEPQLKRVQESLGLLSLLGFDKPKINMIYMGQDSDPDLVSMIDISRHHSIKLTLLNLLPGYLEEKKSIHISLASLIDRIGEFGIRSVRVEQDHNSFSTLLFELNNGALVEIGHHQVGQEYVYAACENCNFRSNCVESVFSHRLTPDGFLQPCLLRDDNLFDLNDYLNGILSIEDVMPHISNYLANL